MNELVERVSMHSMNNQTIDDDSSNDIEAKAKSQHVTILKIL